MPPIVIPEGDEMVMQGFCDLDMNIRFEKGSSLVIQPDATLFCSRNIRIDNYGKWQIDGTFIADGMVINNYGEMACLPVSGSMSLCDRREATWNNFGKMTIGIEKTLMQLSGSFINQGEGNLIINGVYLHREGKYLQFGYSKWLGAFR